MTTLHHGMNLSDLNRLFVSLGGTVEPVRRTGELRYAHPLASERPRANGRRKDAPRHIVAFVMGVERRVREQRRDHKDAA